MSTELSILSWNGNQNEDREGAGWRLEKHLWLKNSCDRFLLPIHPPKKEDSFLLSPSSKISKHRWAPLLRPKQKALILEILHSTVATATPALWQDRSHPSHGWDGFSVSKAHTSLRICTHLPSTKPWIKAQQEKLGRKRKWQIISTVWDL